MRVLAIRSEAGAGDDEPLEPEIGETEQSLRARRAAHHNREPVDELGIQRGGVLGGVAEMLVAVVAATHFGHDLTVGLGQSRAGGAGHRGEVRERGDRAADEAARDVEIGMAADVHVRAERDLGGIAPGVGRGLAREIDRPRHAIGIGADRERDALGDATGELDHLRARHRDVERDLGLAAPVEPLQPARPSRCSRACRWRGTPADR